MLHIGGGAPLNTPRLVVSRAPLCYTPPTTEGAPSPGGITRVFFEKGPPPSRRGPVFFYTRGGSLNRKPPVFPPEFLEISG